MFDSVMRNTPQLLVLTIATDATGRNDDSFDQGMRQTGVKQILFDSRSNQN